MAKFLDKDGLTHFWSKIKTLLSGKADQTSLDQTNQALARVDSTVGSNDGGLVKDLNDLATRVAGKSDSSHTHDSATTSANGFMTKEMVTNIDSLNTFMNTTVPNTYAKKTDISTAYKACGSIDSVPSLAAEYIVGDVLNITAAFTTTEDFVEGAGKQYPAGTNIVKVNVNSAEKWDALAGIVDLSNYVTSEELEEAVGNGVVSISNEEIDTMMNS